MRKYLTSGILFINSIIFCLPPIYSQLQLNELQITNIANEGFLLRSSNHKILIDALFTETYGAFSAPSKETINDILEAKAPFDSVNLYLLTHYHKDHCEPALINQYLKKYPDMGLVTNKPALVFIDGDQFGFVQLKKQFYEITPDINQSMTQTIKSIPVSVFGVKHLSFIRNGIDLEEYMYNASYLIDLDGIKIFHSGDIKMNNLQDFIIKNGTWANKVDIAFLYYDLFNSGISDLEYIITTLNPQYIVLMHILPRNYDTWSEKLEELKKRYPNITFFKNSMESQTVKVTK